MAGGENDQEKTEAPTPRRREDARKEGRIPRSQELSAAVLLLGGSVALAHLGAGAIARESGDFLRESSRWLRAEPLTTEAATTILRAASRTLLLAVAPFLGVVAAMTAAVGLAQGRGVVRLEALEPKFGNLNPVKGLGKIFGTQALFTALKALAKFAVIGLVTWKMLAGAWPQIVLLTGGSESAIAETTRSLALRLALTAGFAFLVITAADYAFEVWRHEKSLKMTKQEIIDEHKQTEGSPMVKQRIRALGQAMVRKRMLGDVAKADVVVTNPTHIAVALKYDPTEHGAPIVLAMGERKLAERIKAAAAKANVPMVENRPLARALLATAKVGRPIPVDLFTAVAEVLAFVYRRRARMGQGGMPGARS